MKWINKIKDWIRRNIKWIVGGVIGFFGILFLYKGKKEEEDVLLEPIYKKTVEKVKEDLETKNENLIEKEKQLEEDFFQKEKLIIENKKESEKLNAVEVADFYNSYYDV